jgi:thiol-disulfide isomerase/thioredoxin
MILSYSCNLHEFVPAQVDVRGISKFLKSGEFMKGQTICLFIIVMLLSMVEQGHSAESFDGSIMPELTLITPESEQHRGYLGLTTKPGETFKINEIEADLLIIELFSMYCPFCQKEAPLVNDLYRKITENETNGLSVKIIGLGASNSQFEVEHFGQTYAVDFPLFPDKDMSIYRALGGTGTPGFVAYKIKGMAAPVNVLRNAGGFYSADGFLKDLIDNSGL